ncbi:MAG: hypothetical protein ACYC8T_04630 [Myxococcaceae bacterium]
MFNTRGTLVCLLAAVALTTGCATLKVQREKVESTKTVALVAFTGEVSLTDPNEKKSSGGIRGSINAIKNVASLASGELEQRRGEQGEKAYAMLSKKLGEGMGWTVLDHGQVAANPRYAELLKQSPNEGVMVAGLQTLKDVLREESVRGLTAAERAELVKGLGVDAVAVARVKYVVGDKSGFSMGGMGKITKYPKAIVQFALFDASGAEPIWNDIWAEGKPTTEGLDDVMGVSVQEKETQVLLSAAESGYDQLISRVHEKK